MREYIFLIAAVIKPRSLHDSSAKFGTLIERRSSLLYWCYRKNPDTTPPGLKRKVQEVSCCSKTVFDI